MTRRVLLDTGPLVAFLNRGDQYHEWARGQFGEISPPMLTCESVLAETCHLLRAARGGCDRVMALLQRGVLALPFRLNDHAESVARLMAKYADVPISLADACLVRMTETNDDCAVLTLDSDFRLYRRHGRGVIPVLMPSSP